MSASASMVGKAVDSVASRFVATSVIRGAEYGEAHGGLCVVDFQTQRVDWVLEWDTTDIDIAGRGGDRGLRGVAVVDDTIWVLSNKALLQFDRAFKLTETFNNPYLKHCHEISVHGGRAYIVSTGFDAILVFDLHLKRFVLAYQLAWANDNLKVLAFDPLASWGPEPCNAFHLNSVKCDDKGLYFAGLRTDGLFRLSGGQFSRVTRLPKGTHNAQPLGDSFIYNDTANDRVCLKRNELESTLHVTFEAGDVAPSMRGTCDKLARPGFARGLCALSAHHLAGGSSPSTITIYDMQAGAALAQLSLSKDVRNAIHGLAALPRDEPSQVAGRVT